MITKTLFFIYFPWTRHTRVLIVPEELVTVTLLVSFPSVGYLQDDLFPAWFTAHWLCEDVTIGLHCTYIVYKQTALSASLYFRCSINIPE